MKTINSDVTNINISDCRETAESEVYTASEVSNGKMEYVHGGQVRIFTVPVSAMTILGPCVSICLWDSRKKIGGMNHYLLPVCGKIGSKSPRYGDVAIQILLRKFEEIGCKKINMTAKVFGGAHVVVGRANGGNLGNENVKTAYSMLNEAGIRIDTSNVGGHKGRKIIFNTGDGRVWIKQLSGE
jgi:chemotaxis protein CheD